jgi:hypothetical protein
MNRLQQVVVILCCLLIVYCCVWVPWHVVQSSADGFPQFRAGYGWLWKGPPNLGTWATSVYATPDLAIIGLRLLAATALAGAALAATRK